MLVLGVVAVFILYTAMQMETPAPELAIIELLIIVVISILAQTSVLVKIYEINLENSCEEYNKDIPIEQQNPAQVQQL